MTQLPVSWHLITSTDEFDRVLRDVEALGFGPCEPALRCVRPHTGDPGAFPAPLERHGLRLRALYATTAEPSWWEMQPAGCYVDGPRFGYRGLGTAELVGALRDKRQPLASGEIEIALDVLELIEAVYRSVASGAHVTLTTTWERSPHHLEREPSSPSCQDAHRAKWGHDRHEPTDSPGAGRRDELGGK